MSSVKIISLMLAGVLLSSCDRLGLGELVHIGVQTKTVLDSASVEPDIDYLAQQKKLSEACISSFRNIETGRGILEYPLSSDNFVSLRHIQRSIIRQLMDAAYAEEYIDHALEKYYVEHADSLGWLGLHTLYNKNNIYAAANGDRCLVYNVSSGVQLSPQMLFVGDYETTFLTVLGRDDITLRMFCITDQGVEFWQKTADGEVLKLQVPSEVAKPFLQDNWKHLWQ